MSGYLKRYISNLKKSPRSIPTKEMIGQCTECLDTFSVYYNDLEGIEPLKSTYIESSDGTLIHKCGGKVNFWRM